jgi:hypothetical protein
MVPLVLLVPIDIDYPPDNYSTKAHTTINLRTKEKREEKGGQRFLSGMSHYYRQLVTKFLIKLRCERRFGGSPV